MDNAMPGCFLKIDVAAPDSKKKGHGSAMHHFKKNCQKFQMKNKKY
jgi:hypothetical protein